MQREQTKERKKRKEKTKAAETMSAGGLIECLGGRKERQEERRGQAQGVESANKTAATARTTTKQYASGKRNTHKEQKGEVEKKNGCSNLTFKNNSNNRNNRRTKEQKNKRTSKQVRGRRQDRIVTKQARERQKRNKGKQNRVTVESKR